MMPFAATWMYLEIIIISDNLWIEGAPIRMTADFSLEITAARR